MRNSPPSETETLRLGLQEIRRRLPVGWKVDVSPRSRPAVSQALPRPDATARLKGPDGRSAELVIEVKTDGSPQATRVATRQLRDWRPKAEPLFIAPFLPPRSRKIAEEAGVNYTDLTGNMRLSVSRPALFLRDRGDKFNPYPGRDVERSLAGPTAARVILWLCQLSTPASPGLLKEIAQNMTVSLTKVAQDSKVSLAYVSRLIRLLEREDLVRRKPRGPIGEMDRPGLVRRWAQDYDLLRSNRARLFLDPRGALRTLDTMGSPDFGRAQTGQIAVTGSFAANRYAPVAAPSKLVCYVEDVDATARALDLSPSSTSGNVFLLTPYDGIVFEAVRDAIQTSDGSMVPMAPPAQIAVDCLTGPDRMPEEGEALLGWLQKNWSGWKGFSREEQP